MKTRFLWFAAILLATITVLPLGLKAQSPIGNWKWENDVMENDYGTLSYYYFAKLRLSKDGTFRFSHGKKETWLTHGQNITVEAWRKGTYIIEDKKLYLKFSDDPIEFTTQRGFRDGTGRSLIEILNETLNSREKEIKEETTELADNALTKRNSFLISENTLTRLVLKWPIPEKEDDDNTHVWEMIKDTSK
jgi:hypothetical protein